MRAKVNFPSIPLCSTEHAVVLLGQDPRVEIRAYSAIENDPIVGSFSMAERARFELAVSCPTTVFKTVTLNHSVTYP